MRMIVALVVPAALVGLVAPGLAFAAEPLKATFACEIVEEGRRSKLPTRRIRLDYPVECKLSVAGAARPEPYAARVVTTWTDYEGRKAVRKKSEHSGKVNGAAPWIATLAPDKDFDACLDVVIEAVLTAPGEAKPAWSKKITVKQECPD